MASLLPPDLHQTAIPNNSRDCSRLRVWRCALAAALASTALLAAPIRAQDQEAPPRLEDLIPDSAVDNPEDWATQGVPAAPGEEETAQTTLAADAPMGEMPQITVEWPEAIELAPLEPIEGEAEQIEYADFSEEIPPLPLGSEERLSEELVLVFPTDTTLFPERDEFLDRFKSLSTVEQLDDNDNMARLAAQASDDEELLIRLLRIYGYYDAQVIRSVGDVDAATQVRLDRPAVRFDVIPSQRYRIGNVDLGDLAQTGDDYTVLRASYDVYPGDYISQDAIEKERFDLDVALGDSGYPFAAIADPELLIDHARDEGDVTMLVTPGGKYRFRAVTSNLPDYLPADHLTRIARWDAGDVYRRTDEQDLRRAILATGIVGSVTLTPVEIQPPQGDTPGVVDIAAELTTAPLRTLAGNIGYGTAEGIRVEASWEHRNLFPPEGSLKLRGILGTQEQLAGVTFRKNNFKGRDRILTLDAFASTIDYDAYDARTISTIATFEQVSTLLYQKPLSWSAGLELVATQETERDAAGDPILPRETYFVAALPLYAQIDTSDDLLDPTKGWRLSGRVSPEISDNSGIQSFYIRNQVDASYYRSVSDNVVLAGRARVASIPGAELAEIAPSRRLYSGGGGSVRGYGYREIGPLNSSGDPLGGRSLAEFSLEARVQTGLFDGALGVVPFVDVGHCGP